MHIWTSEEWKTNPHIASARRTGLRLVIECSVDKDLGASCRRFAQWIRKEYYFPLRVPVYIKGARFIKTMDGDTAVGTFFEPDTFNMEPYIKIATGDYSDLLESIGRDNAIASILNSISHELTHYFQWINGLTSKLTPIGIERQATMYSHFIVDEYSETCEHP